MGRLEGKVAIITGAGAGMGREGAKIFTGEGAKVVVAEWNAEGGEETVRMVKEAGGEAIFIKTDVSREDDIKKMIKVTVDTYGKLDILYNNAGIAPDDPLEQWTEEKFYNVIDVDLKGVIMGMKYAIPQMIKGGGGSVINVGSVAALRAFPNITSYTAAKGAVVALTMAVAVQYAPQNIRVNCINPGTTGTALLLEARRPEELQTYTSAIPLGRYAKPEEQARVALFLASDESSYMTGCIIPVDGGLVADSHLKA